MLQRIQTVYLLIAILLGGLVAFLVPFWADSNDELVYLNSMLQTNIQLKDISMCFRLIITVALLHFTGSDDETVKTQVAKELVQLVREKMGPVAAFRLAVSVGGLPRTRSGKTARKSIADMAAGKELQVIAVLSRLSFLHFL